ncbi:MAG: adenine deaminase [Leadbetterella sp.]
MKILQGNIIDIFQKTCFFGEIRIVDSKIYEIVSLGPENFNASYFMPGLVDAHVHIESSLLPPSSFAVLALKHGTIATVSDPHEIANVLGQEGVEYMLRNAEESPLKFHFGAPSCVPASIYETAGDRLDSDSVKKLLDRDDIYFLSEMMDYPGVLRKDTEIVKKINYAQKAQKPIDGHAPGLMGEDATQYFEAGISTDHECFGYDEALEKLQKGVKVLIREGSAAKNFDTLIPLAKEYSQQMMFCTDDIHPDLLKVGHINQLLRRAINAGVDKFEAIRMASFNPVEHYKLNMGLLRPQDDADFIEVDSIFELNVKSVYIRGNRVVYQGQVLTEAPDVEVINRFEAPQIHKEDIEIVKPAKATKLNCIQCIDGQIVTEKIQLDLPLFDAPFEDWLLQNEIQKIVVYNRYKSSLPAVGYIKGFRLKEGALASSVAHDSHNIVCVGTDDRDMVDAINRLVDEKGGLCAVSNKKLGVIPLPIAGLMSDRSPHHIADDYAQLDAFVKNVLGSKLTSPFMTLSFMALLVIPHYKLSDKGLFDSEKQEFSGIFE